MLLFYGQFYAPGRINKPNEQRRQWREAKTETTFRYGYGGMWTEVPDACGYII